MTSTNVSLGLAVVTTASCSTELCGWYSPGLSPHRQFWGCFRNPSALRALSSGVFFCLPLKHFHFWGDFLQAEGVCSRELQGCLQDMLSPDVPTDVKAALIAPQLHLMQSSGAVPLKFSLFLSLLGQFLKTPSHRTDTTGSTLPCCWLALDFSFHTTASSRMWTTCTTNTQVGLRQRQPFLLPKPRQSPHLLPLCRDLHSL